MRSAQQPDAPARPGPDPGPGRPNPPDPDPWDCPTDPGEPLLTVLDVPRLVDTLPSLAVGSPHERTAELPASQLAELRALCQSPARPGVLAPRREGGLHVWR